MGEYLPTAEQSSFAPEETFQILGQLALDEEIQLPLPIETVE